MGASKYLSHYNSSCGKWGLGSHIFYSNRSSRVVNLRGLDKYSSKNTGRQTNVQAKIGGTYRQMRMDRVYIQEVTNIVHIWEGKEQEGKDAITIRSNEKKTLWYKLIS